jgi:POT family proton-dependent oligopeptide transporter
MADEREILLTAFPREASPKPSPSSYSRSSSPDYGATRPALGPDDDLPTNISSEEQLASLPEVCLSGNKERPLRHVNEKGEVSHYALQPMFYSVIFILLVELLERFSFYGVNYTQTSFLTGAYDEHWNAGMTSVGASSYVSISTAVAYTMPFVGAFLADSLLGDYWAILFGSVVFYIPGLLLITLSTVPNLLGETFNTSLLGLGLLVLWPIGTGIVKSIVNVFGARQFHPLLQSSLIESYYVNFYMCINIGALVGGIIVPIVAQYDITLAYSYPVGMLCIGVLLFLLGTQRYVRQRPIGDTFSKTPKDSNVDPSIGLGTVFRISILIIPFCIAYSQMATTFIVQGTVMKKAFGFIDAASMNNADAVSVLFFGYMIGVYLYPALARRGIKIPTTYKFAIGSGLGALAIGWALLMEYKIQSTFEATGEKVNILWQSLAYVLIGAGEIFAVSAAYEVAFTSAPPEKKVLASAVNLFCVGGIPNVLCICLYQACKGWFRNSRGTASISRLEDYATARVDYYFIVLLGVSLVGVFVNLLPPVRDFVASIEEKAIEMVKTPVMKRPTRHRRKPSQDYSSDEESPMLRLKRHQAYLKYGSGPVLYKQGSMRAGPSLSQREAEKKQPKKHLKKSMLGKLYRTKPKMPKVVLNSEGKPLTAGKVYKRQDSL